MRMTASGRALRLLLSLAVIIVLMAVPAGIPVPTRTLPAASAEPAPGEPGGNHSLPGDNKKKKRDDDQRRVTLVRIGAARFGPVGLSAATAGVEHAADV